MSKIIDCPRPRNDEQSNVNMADYKVYQGILESISNRPETLREIMLDSDRSRWELMKARNLVGHFSSNDSKLNDAFTSQLSLLKTWEPESKPFHPFLEDLLPMMKATLGVVALVPYAKAYLEHFSKGETGVEVLKDKEEKKVDVVLHPRLRILQCYANQFAAPGHHFPHVWRWLVDVLEIPCSPTSPLMHVKSKAVDAISWGCIWYMTNKGKMDVEDLGLLLRASNPVSLKFNDKLMSYGSYHFPAVKKELMFLGYFNVAKVKNSLKSCTNRISATGVAGSYDTSTASMLGQLGNQVLQNRMAHQLGQCACKCSCSKCYSQPNCGYHDYEPLSAEWFN